MISTEETDNSTGHLRKLVLYDAFDSDFQIRLSKAHAPEGLIMTFEETFDTNPPVRARVLTYEHIKALRDFLIAFYDQRPR